MIEVPVKHLQEKSSSLHQFATSFYNELGGSYFVPNCLFSSLLLESLLNVLVGNFWETISRNGPNRSGRFVICCSEIQSIKCVKNRKAHLLQPSAIL